MGQKLTEEQVAAQIDSLQGWALEESKWIVKKYRFREFMAGIRFIGEVAGIAEEQNHHPMIAIDYRLVTLRLTSWNAGGLTDLDFAAAQAYDLAYQSSE